MKNFIRLIGIIGIIAIAAITGFGFVACDTDSGGGGGGADTAPVITTTTLPKGTVNAQYSQTLNARGTAPITWTLDTGSLPGGLTLSTAGVISGTPATANTYNFTVKAANSAGSATKALSILIETGNESGKLAISINRADSSPTEFVFRTAHPAGAASYEVKKGSVTLTAEMLANPDRVKVTGQLDADAFAELTATAKAGAEAKSQAKVPGMYKYDADTPTLKGYTDWFKFLDATLLALKNVDYDAYDPHGDFRNSIAAEIRDGISDEDAALRCKTRYETEANAAMKVVLANLPAIMGYFNENISSSTWATRLDTVKETMPRLWFNKVANAENDDALNEIMSITIKAEYPDVKDIS
jgi:hypothetical protein